MSDISVKFIADKLGKDIESATPRVLKEINQAVADIANATYAAIISNAQAKLQRTRQDYLSGLNFTKIGDNSYLISLSGEFANMLEGGFDPYDMRETLLNSGKTVGVGPRAGQPWVRKTKEGKKYAAVPFEHRPFSKAGRSGDLATDIKQLLAENRQGGIQNITEKFLDDLGKPLSGKVATAITTPETPANLKGLTKFQHISPKGRVSSLYMTWRIISENGDNWMHPGHPGFHFFKEAEKYVEQELENIINTLL